MVGPVARALTAIALIFGTGQVHDRTPPPSPLELAGEFVPRPAVAKLASLGFDAALADYYWLRAVQIVGAAQADPAEHTRVLAQLVDVVTTLDPWVDHPYRFAAVWLTDGPESVRKANALLRRGIEHHPNEWRNYFYLGFNHFFYLGENAEAADVLARATLLPGAPPYLPRLVARLRSQSGTLETAGAFIAQLARDAEDETLRVNYLVALDEIDVERNARVLDHARARFRERRGRDIEFVDELVLGADAVLEALPDPEPTSLPVALRRGARWELAEESGRIVSSYYGRRYELSFHPADAKQREAWRTGEPGGSS